VCANSKLSCSYSITPAEISRVSFTEMKCPKCGKVFEAVKAHYGESVLGLYRGECRYVNMVLP